MQHTSDNQKRDDGDKESIAKLPEPLKTGIEALSGLSMEDVHVHYHSSLPAQVEALAYTQGTDIYIALGQEKHLAHEAWHVVQQKQGRVKPTLQARGRAINDDQALEREADVMGQKAVEHSFTRQQQWGTEHSVPSQLSPISNVIQRMWGPDEVRGGVTYRMWFDTGEGGPFKGEFWYRLKQPSGEWEREADVEEVGKELPEEEKGKGKDEKATGPYHDVPELVEVFGALGYKRSDKSDIFMSWGASEQNVASGWKLHAGCGQGQWVLVATEVTKLLRRLKLAHKVMVVQETLLSGSQRKKLITVWSTEDMTQMKKAIEIIDATLTKLGVSVEDAAIPNHIMTGPTNRVAVRYGGNQPVTAATLKENGITVASTISMRLPDPTGPVAVYTINPRYLGGSLKGGQVPIYEGPNGALRAYDKQTNPALMLQTDSEEQPILYPDLRDNPLQSELVGVPFPKEFSGMPSSGAPSSGMPYVTLNEDQWKAYLQSLGVEPAVLIQVQDEKHKGQDQPLAPPSPSASDPGKDEKHKGDEQAQLNARQMFTNLYSKVQAMLIEPGGDYSQLWANYKSNAVRAQVKEIMQQVENFYNALLKLKKEVDAAGRLDENLILMIGNTNDILVGVVTPQLVQALLLEKGKG